LDIEDSTLDISCFAEATFSKLLLEKCIDLIWYFSGIWDLELVVWNLFEF
jgi:hypothetical protein